MARPRIDHDEIRNRLLVEAEKQLEETSGRRLVLSEIADRVGISQPYVHKFFTTKADLVRALAQRWFDDVEHASGTAVETKSPPGERLELWLLSLLRLKRGRFDENPALFNAYLRLAADHPDLVTAHAERLRTDLGRIVADLVPAEGLAGAIELIEDATILFRMPVAIACFRQSATDRRAKAVVKLLVGEMSRTRLRSRG